MSLRDFGVLILICLVWAGNNIISKIVVAHWGVPPLAYAAVRFGLVALVTLPWLLPAPRPGLAADPGGPADGRRQFRAAVHGLQDRLARRRPR